VCKSQCNAGGWFVIQDASSIAGSAPYTIINEVNINPIDSDYDSTALPCATLRDHNLANHAAAEEL